MLQLSSNAAKLVSKDSLTQWLGFYSSTVGDLGSIPGWGPKILQAAHTAKKKKKKKKKSIYTYRLVLIPDVRLLTFPLWNLSRAQLTYLSQTCSQGCPLSWGITSEWQAGRPSLHPEVSFYSIESNGCV